MSHQSGISKVCKLKGMISFIWIYNKRSCFS